MMFLTVDDVHVLLDLLSYKTVYEFGAGRYRLTERTHGYSEDLAIGRLQAKLSIMGEAASKEVQ